LLSLFPSDLILGFVHPSAPCVALQRLCLPWGPGEAPTCPRLSGSSGLAGRPCWPCRHCPPLGCEGLRWARLASQASAGILAAAEGSSDNSSSSRRRELAALNRPGSVQHTVVGSAGTEVGRAGTEGGRHVAAGTAEASDERPVVGPQF
jgi:hypothetical protein